MCGTDSTVNIWKVKVQYNTAVFFRFSGGCGPYITVCSGLVVL
jgi:hypothetical protein